ncbi:MAG: phenylacetate--CoA ligase [Candidatus Nephthysia bennettiae]|uniref:Phenylacetate--CoA ligase family protein n=1 Tax=Candidatus Nephthysia bennettiae TaxID=3127016 RepID=A0A934NFU2_9BACT|nr:phenylacetate--CoA ligase family protein [Candidatus Dormibacteraeota bacterium]MBJ7612081.1 phenylacetate--CoA ligase family protein [Candidatus Dormibacteraeota bacterium]PZR91942.1 MAG: phenylacetate--CoA ligase [Candidatus Dormibacteraeota bacterium]
MVSPVRLPGDRCERDSIWDRQVETAPPAEVSARAAAAWDMQARRLLETSPFHARRFAQAGAGSRPPGLGDLSRLPLTTKDELRQAIEEAPPFGSNAGVRPEQIKRVYQTSGTTGAPSVIALSGADVDTWTAIGSRTYYATGLHDHHSVLSTFGAGPFVAGHTNFVLSRIGPRVVPVGPGDTERVLFALRAGIVDTLLSTASFAQYLANRVASAGAGPASLGLVHVVTGGEPGGGIPAVRDHIQDVLGVTVNEVMGIGDVAPSLFGECPLQQGMHFCGTGHVWPELIDAESGDLLEIEQGAVGELVYTHLTREAMPVVRFRGGDIVRIEGTSCACGRTSFRMRCLGRRDDMFIVRGVNVYPAAIVAVVGEFRPRVTGRARVVRAAGSFTVDPPVPVEVEVADALQAGGAAGGLAAELEQAIRARLNFRARVELVPEAVFGASGYKTPLTVSRG